MSATHKKQYNLLNALKIIAAFFVVTIHIHFPGDFGLSVIAIARFAVPFFFMVSGFFSYYENKTVLNEKYKRKIKHVFVLFLGGTGLYFIYGMSVALYSGTAVSYLGRIFSIKSVLEFLLFNNTSVSEFLWFLPALIYTYTVFFIFEKTGITKKMYFLIPVLFLFGIFFREMLEYIPDLPAIMSNGYVYRNFAFVGLPFFMLGHFIKANEDIFTEKFSNISLVILMIVGSAEAVAVELLHAQKSVYIGTFIAVFALFLFAVKNEEKYSVAHIADAGAKYSLYVYIFHIMIRNVMNKGGEIIPIAGEIIDLLEPVYPIVIFALSLVASAVYSKVKKTVLSVKKTEKLGMKVTS